MKKSPRRVPRGEKLPGKRARRRPRRSEELLHQLAENLRQVLYVIDTRAYRPLYVSPAYEDLWGRSLKEAYSNPRAWLEAIHPGDRDRVVGAMERFHRGEGEFCIQYRVVRPDGSTRWVWDRSFRILNARGQPYREVGIAQDITQGKDVEQQLCARARQQAAVATLGQRAVAGAGRSDLIDGAVEAVARALEVDFSSHRHCGRRSHCTSSRSGPSSARRPS